MNLRYSGIGHATGENDTGKTRFFLEVAPLSRIALFHDDVKMPPHADQMGLFIDMKQECKNMKMMEMGQWFVQQINQMKVNEFDAIICDTWTNIEQALRYWGKQHASTFREASTFSIMGKMKSGEEWKEGDRYTARVISDMASKVKFVGLITHIKEENIAGAKTGKMIPDASKVLNTACNFRVWLRKNPNSGVPIALVLKRLAEDKVVDGMLKTVNILPWKLTPKDSEESIWDTIDRYREHPFGNRQPMPDETPDSFEMSILTGVMTKEQREIWQANLREKHVMEQESELLLDSQEDNIVARVKAMDSEGLGLVEITDAINSEFSRDFGPGDISNYLDRS